MLIAATDRGVVLLEGAGSRWAEKRRTLVDHEATAVSVRRDIVLAGSREGVFRSDDGGQTWNRPARGPSIAHIRWLLQHPDREGLALAGTEPAMIFVSEDAGQTWAERLEVAELREAHGWYLPYSPEAGCVRGFAGHGERLYAAVEQGGVLRSDDAGATWRLVDGSSGEPNHDPPEGTIQNDVHSLSVHPSSPDMVLAATGGGLFRSEDGGATWSHLYDCYCRAAWADPEDPGHIVFGPADGVSENGRIETSRDGGETWQPGSDGLNVPWPEHMVERMLLHGGSLFAVLSNGQVVVSRPDELGWRYAFVDVREVNALAAIG